jgi:hypothetical protein
MELTSYPDNAAMRSDVLTDLVGGGVGDAGRGYEKRCVKPLLSTIYFCKIDNLTSGLDRSASLVHVAACCSLFMLFP